MSNGNQKISVPLRIVVAIAAVAGIGLLIVAGRLQPNSHGHSTHMQLGLPPCGMLARYGRPCPSCGMTTSWSHLMRGEIGSSLNANPAGTWLGIWVGLISVWGLAGSIFGKWKLFQPNQWFFLGLSLSFLLFAVVVWIIRFFF